MIKSADAREKVISLGKSQKAGIGIELPRGSEENMMAKRHGRVLMIKITAEEGICEVIDMRAVEFSSLRFAMFNAGSSVEDKVIHKRAAQVSI